MRLLTALLVTSLGLAATACGSTPEPAPQPAASKTRVLATFRASQSTRDKLGVQRWVLWVTPKGTLVYEGMDSQHHHVSHLSFRIGRDGKTQAMHTYNLGWADLPSNQKGIARFRTDKTPIESSMPNSVVSWTKFASYDFQLYSKRGGKLSYGCAGDILWTVGGVLASIAACNPISEVLSGGTATFACAGALVGGVGAGAVSAYEDCFSSSSQQQTPDQKTSSNDQGGTQQASNDTNGQNGNPSTGASDPGADPNSGASGNPDPGTGTPSSPGSDPNSPGSTPDPNSGTPDPGTPDPNSAPDPNAGAPDPGTPDPGSSNPGGSDPGSSDPGGSDPGGSEVFEV